MKTLKKFLIYTGMVICISQLPMTKIYSQPYQIYSVAASVTYPAGGSLNWNKTADVNIKIYETTPCCAWPSMVPSVTIKYTISPLSVV